MSGLDIDFDWISDIPHRYSDKQPAYVQSTGLGCAPFKSIGAFSDATTPKGAYAVHSFIMSAAVQLKTHLLFTVLEGQKELLELLRKNPYARWLGKVRSSHTPSYDVHMFVADVDRNFRKPNGKPQAF